MTLRYSCVFGVLIAIALAISNQDKPISSRVKREKVHGRCKIILNEVFFTSSNNNNWAEIAKVCPETRRGTESAENSRTMHGYKIAVLSSKGDKLKIQKVMNLYSELLQDIPVTNEANADIPVVCNPSPSSSTSGSNERTESENPGNPETCPRLPKFPRLRDWTLGQPISAATRTTTTTAEEKEAQPMEVKEEQQENTLAVKYLYTTDVGNGYEKESDVKVVMILHYTAKEQREKANLPDTMIDGVDATREMLENMQKHAVDIIVTGKKWVDDLHPGIIDLAQATPIANTDYVLFPWHNNLKCKQGQVTKSICRCGLTYGGFVPEVFKYCAPTKGRLNQCNVNEEFIVSTLNGNYPFALHRTTLTKHAQQIIVNLHHALTKGTITNEILKINPHLLISTLTNVGKSTVKRILHQHKNKEEFKVGKKGEYKGKLSRLLNDPEMKKIITKIITDSYKQNIAPNAKYVFEEFVKEIRKRQLEEAQKAALDPNLTSEDMPMLFSLSFRTFNRLLHQLGFKYARINTRAVLIMDERIINWREIYLAARERLKDMPTIWLDETWVDTFDRSHRGWQPAQTLSYSELKDFCYAKSKGTRGPRLIIIAAGGAKGMVPNSCKVFGIKTDEEYSDYHRNVNSAVFKEWFQKLLNQLGDEKHVIIMDNASYHSVSDLPSSQSTKQVLYDALNKIKDEYPTIIKLKVFKDERVVNLKAMLTEVKMLKQHYTIDKLAKAKGHQVLRLPPYNCELNPIEMVWANIKGRLRVGNNQDLQAQKNRAEDFCNSFGADKWEPYVRHVEKLEEKFRRDDSAVRNFIENNPEMQVLNIGLEDADGEPITERAPDYSPGDMDLSNEELEIHTALWEHPADTLPTSGTSANGTALGNTGAARPAASGSTVAVVPTHGNGGVAKTGGGITSKAAVEPSKTGGGSTSKAAVEPSKTGGGSTSKAAVEPSKTGGGSTSKVAVEPSKTGGGSTSKAAVEPSKTGGGSTSKAAAGPAKTRGTSSKGPTGSKKP